MDLEPVSGNRVLYAAWKWVDRWVPASLTESRRDRLRARVVVCASSFAVVASLTAQSIRLSQEDQHWIPLLAWALCTLLFVLTPILLRYSGNLALSAASVSLAVLIGALGVSIKEGGISSPNAMVMIVSPVVATLLGGVRSGGLITVLVIALCATFLGLHQGQIISDAPAFGGWTMLVMRATVIGALAVTVYVLTLFYELERDRSDRELSSRADELEHARYTEAENARIKLDLFASEQREAERERQLAAAVQKLLLPKRDQLDTDFASLAGYSVPAADTGGDWWFAEVLRDGGLRVVLGDVTGHGAASAMVAAVVAGAFRAAQETGPFDVATTLEVLHKVLSGVSAGHYTMPFGVLEVSTSGRARWWSAAAPPILVLRRDGSVDAYAASGHPLGDARLVIGETAFDLQIGDRVLLCSDGVTELRMDSGRELGVRRLKKLLCSSQKSPLKDARDALATGLERARGSQMLHDDVTFALIERKNADDLTGTLYGSSVSPRP